MAFLWLKKDSIYKPFKLLLINDFLLIWRLLFQFKFPILKKKFINGHSWAPRNTSHGSVILNNFYSSNLLCICSSLLEKNLNKAKYGVFEKLSRIFSMAGSRFDGK